MQSCIGRWIESDRDSRRIAKETVWILKKRYETSLMAMQSSENFGKGLIQIYELAGYVCCLLLTKFQRDFRRSLVPRVIGQTAEAKEKNSTGSQPSINESEFFQVLEENTSPQDAEVAKQILDWSNQKASNVKWRNVSFAPRFDCNSSYPHMPVSVSVDGKVGINFVRMKRSHQLPDEVRLEILRRLNTIPGIDLPQDSIERKPTIPLAALADDSVLGQFLDIMGWTLELVEAAHRDTAANMQSLSAPTQ